MAKTSNNKYPADKTGTKYSEFKNTKRIPPGKTKTDRIGKQGSAGTEPAADKNASSTAAG